MRYCAAKRPLARIAILAALLAPLAGAWQDPSFVFEATNPTPYTAAYLGNGAISLVTTPLAVDPAPTFLAGVYDHSPGDVPRIAAAPAWNVIEISNGAHWLNHQTPLSQITQYSQTLDMYNGLLRTSYVWTDGTKSALIRVEQFVARDRPEVGLARVTFTPQFTAAVTIRFPLENWPPAHRYPLEQTRNLEGEARTNPWAIWYPGRLDISETSAEAGPQRTMSLLARAPGYRIRVGEAVAIQWTGYAPEQVHNDRNSADSQLHFDVHPGQSYTFSKFAALESSAGSSDVRSAALLAARAARDTGWDRLLASSEAEWHRLWDADLVVEGDASLQQTMHSMLFYLLGSARRNANISIPPMGLSSAGYYGHIFWDADTFMFPALVILHPDLARPMVAFRAHTLAMAVANAKKNGYRGAMYPWEAGPDGAESTPRFAAQNASSENHVNGDIALASWQYWIATGDRNWLRTACWPILRDTADFWVSRVNFNTQRGRYEILNVVAVKESDIGVSNDPYTNAVARKNLELALAAARELHLQPHPKWRDVMEKMYLPDSSSSLLWYPLDRQFSAEQIRQAVQSMLSRIHNGKSGAMMGTEFYPILAAQLGDRVAIRELLDPLSVPYLRPPFQVVAETPSNQNTNFITGAGAFLQQFIFGYTGLRLTQKGLERKYPTILPPGVRRLILRNVTIRGRRQTLTFE